MLTTPAIQDQLLQDIVELAEAEADILVRLARWRPPGQDKQVLPFEPELVNSEQLVRWSREIAAALLICQGPKRSGVGTASRIWSRVRAVLMMYQPDWTIDEFLIFHFTRNQHCGFPFGMAASELIQLADGDFTAPKIRTAIRRHARKGLLTACYTRRVAQRAGNRIPRRETIWFYSGPDSKYEESRDLVYYMHTPWDERPADNVA